MTKKKEGIELAKDYQRFITNGLLALYTKYSRPTQSGANLFLGKWIINAQKQKLFCKGLAEHIDLFVKLHKAKGFKSGLQSMFEKIYLENKTTSICFKSLEDSDKDRIKSTLKELKDKIWETNFPVQHDPDELGPYEPLAEKEVFVLEENWQNAIHASGKLAKPLRVYSTEVLQELVDEFYTNGFYIVLVNKSQSDNRNENPRWYYSFDIYPHDEPQSGVEIPSIHNG